MRQVLAGLALGAWRSSWMPVSIKRIVSYALAGSAWRQAKWIEENPFNAEADEWIAPGSHLPVLGIVKENWGLHWHYIAACRELGVSYRLIDLSGPNWLNEVARSGCTNIIARPSVQKSYWKHMFDERLGILESLKRYRIFPDPESLWIWESKRRTSYWLQAHSLPHPHTWVFYDEKQAVAFAETCSMPIVYKADMGSGSSGVRIVRSRGKLKGLIHKCFRRGFRSERRERLDIEVGFILLQEYLPDVSEWRIVRVGDSFFGFEKVKIGDFHSGSHTFRYGHPPVSLLDMVRSITDRHGFRSVDFDIFVHPDRGPLINEIQAHFGQEGSREICRINGESGRLIYDNDQLQWQFEAGEFCRNFMCNLRVDYVVREWLDGSSRLEAD